MKSRLLRLLPDAMSPRNTLITMVMALITSLVLVFAVQHFADLEAETVVTALFVVAAVAVNIYFPLFCLRRWWDTGPGQALWVKSLGNVIIIDMSLAYLLYGDYPHRDIIRITGMTVFSFGMVYLLITLLRSPRRGRPQSAPESAPYSRPGQAEPFH